jgi:hypothetical protein
MKTKPKPKEYVVRLDERGYIGSTPWTPVPLSDAIHMTAKQARISQNRCASYNFGFPNAVIEKLK